MSIIGLEIHSFKVINKIGHVLVVECICGNVIKEKRNRVLKGFIKNCGCGSIRIGFDEELALERRNRNYRLISTYGITIWDYERILEEQDNKCAICRLMTSYELHIDHDHSTGKIRGLLCRECNHGLGNFRDDPIRLIAAAHYLEKDTI